MFAHGDGNLRSKEQNIADGLTSVGAITAYRVHKLNNSPVMVTSRSAHVFVNPKAPSVAELALADAAPNDAPLSCTTFTEQSREIGAVHDVSAGTSPTDFKSGSLRCWTDGEAELSAITGEASQTTTTARGTPLVRRTSAESTSRHLTDRSEAPPVAAVVVVGAVLRATRRWQHDPYRGRWSYKCVSD